MTQARTLALITTLIFTVLSVYADVPRTLGAHPWWALQVVYIGAPVGFILAALVTWRAPLSAVAVLILAILTIAAFAISVDGKSRFAASYAEDVLAGRMWYFGWISTTALCAATVFTAVHAVTTVLRPDTP